MLSWQLAISKGKTITNTSGNNLSSRYINISGRTHKTCDILDQLSIRPIDPKRNYITQQLGAIKTILDQSLRIRQVKEQSVNRADCVPAITEKKDLIKWLVSAGWTDLYQLIDELPNITFERVKGKGWEIMSGVIAWLMSHYLFPIADVVELPEVGDYNHEFSPANRKPLRANRKPIHRDNPEKYPDGSRPVSVNTVTVLIRKKGLPLARGRMQQGMGLIGEIDGILEDALSEIDSRENRNTGTEGKARVDCMVAIALIRDLFQWLPSQKDKPEYSQPSSFVATGSSLGILLHFYDLTCNLLTGKNSPNCRV